MSAGGTSFVLPVSAARTIFSGQEPASSHVAIDRHRVSLSAPRSQQLTLRNSFFGNGASSQFSAGGRRFSPSGAAAAAYGSSFNVQATAARAKTETHQRRRQDAALALFAVAVSRAYLAKKADASSRKIRRGLEKFLARLTPERPATLAMTSAAAGEVAARPPTNPLLKLIPLGAMFFLILFNYTILRDTKDVLVVTAPGSGAEAIPFIKTYVCVPSAICYALLYSSMANRLNREQLFYAALSPFLLFFVTFSTLIYPNRAFLHPNAFADYLQTILPAGLSGVIAIIRNWTFAMFYATSELWGSVVVSLLFWGFANEVMTVDEAKKYYPLFGLGANVALIFSGRVVKYLSDLRTRLPPGIDKWGVSLNYLMSCLVLGTMGIAGVFYFMNRVVMTDPTLYSPKKAKETKSKLKMSLGDSMKYLAKSPYILNLLMLVVSYGMAINLVEVTWKSKMKEQFPNPNDYSSFMGDFSSTTGIITLGMMLFGRFILQRFGWSTAALVTPAVLCTTGLMFFTLVVFGQQLAPLTLSVLGMTPLFLAVLTGAAQNIMSKSCKYSLFDPCKEMAYIPLDAESRLKGKAAIDVIGNPIGKSGGAIVQQVLLFTTGSIAASTPALAVVLGIVSVAWIYAAHSLGIEFNKKEKAARAADAHGGPSPNGNGAGGAAFVVDPVVKEGEEKPRDEPIRGQS